MQEVFTDEEVAVYHYNLLLNFLRKLEAARQCNCIPVYAHEVLARSVDEMLWFQSALGLDRVKRGKQNLLYFYFLTSKNQINAN